MLRLQRILSKFNALEAQYMGRKNDNGAIMRWRRNMWVELCVKCSHALEAQHVGKTVHHMPLCAGGATCG